MGNVANRGPRAGPAHRHLLLLLLLLLSSDLLSEQKSEGRKKAERTNIQHPTSNIRYLKGSRHRHWMFDVRCWMFDVEILRPSELGLLSALGFRPSDFNSAFDLRASGFGFDPRLCLGVTHRAAPVHGLEAFSGGTLVVEGDVLGSGGCPNLARNNARTSGGSPVLESSMRRRTS